MKNRYKLGSLLFAATIAVSCNNKTQDTERPNILFIMVDDLRPELGSFGENHIISPNIDKLAKSGLLFNRSYCNVSVSGATRASLMTGLYATPKRFTSYMSRIDKDAPGIISMAGTLKNSGYQTIQIGKIQHFPDDGLYGWSETPRRPDFPNDITVQENWRDYQSEELKHLADKELPGGGAGPAWECADVSDTAYCDGKTAVMAVEKIKELASSDKPFFLGVGFIKPHLPFNAPKKYWDLYDEAEIKLSTNSYYPQDIPMCALHTWGELKSYTNIDKKAKIIEQEQEVKLRHAYFAAISYIDAQIGKVLDELDRQGLRDNTIVMLLGDHGFSLGENNMWCKTTTLERSVRTPLIISSPKHLKGVTTESLVSYVDIYPTICDLTATPKPEHLQGHSLIPILEDNKAIVNEQIYTRWGRGEAIITDRYSYTEYIKNSGEVYENMLYDYKKDPQQNINIAKKEENNKIITTLHKNLEVFLKNRN